MDILIDYLTFTLKEYTYSDLIDLLGLRDVQFVAGRAYNGWQECNYCNGVKLLLGGREDVCADLSGVGCRFLETANGDSFDWASLLSWLEHEPRANISRLDVACDDKTGLLQMPKMVKYTADGKYISRARKRRWISGDEESIIFGSPSSDTRLRIYNKALERGVKGEWLRAEFQFRDQAADSFILNLEHVKDIGLCYGGVMNNYLRYTIINPETCDGHYERVPTVRWWREFLGTVAKIKNITVGGMEYNYGTLVDYLEKQVASSIRTYVLANGGDISGLLEMAQKAKLSKKQRMMLWTHQISQEWAQAEKEGVVAYAE